MTPLREKTVRANLSWAGGNIALVGEQLHPPRATVSLSASFGGPEGAWNPEALLVSAVESSVMLAFLAEAKSADIVVAKYTSDAEGVFGQTPTGRLLLTELTIRPKVELREPEDVPRARALLSGLGHRSMVAASLKHEPRIVPDVRAQRLHELARDVPEDETNDLHRAHHPPAG